jgi:signal recognition particle receptor subunit beta
LNFWRGSWKTSKRVRATEWLIQDKKNLIASSKQEADDLTTQPKIEQLAELSTLSWQIVSGEDKDNEAVIAEADHVRLEAIEAIDEFLQYIAL